MPAPHSTTHTSHAFDPRTTSPFVPMSMKRLNRSASYSRVASTPATMSLPTYAPTAGSV